MRRLALACLVALGLAASGPAAFAQSQNAQNNPSFNLVNRARQPINELYATPQGVDNWGKEVLGDSTVAPGASYAVRLPIGQCTYDVRVVYGDGRSEEKRNLDTCNLSDVVFNGSTATANQGGGSQGGSQGSAGQGGTGGRSAQGGGRGGAQQAGGLSFTVTNLSKSTISSVFATPTGVDNWGKDRLGNDDVIQKDETRTINVPNEGKCIYDIRFVYQDDSTFEKRKVDLCHDPVKLRVN